MFKTLHIPNFFPSAPTHRVPAKSLARIKKRHMFQVSMFRLWTSGFLAVLCLALLFSYLVGVNSYAAKGYEIKKLQTHITQLSEQNEKLNFKVSEASSMVAIQTDFLNTNFVAAGPAKFLQINHFSQK